MEKIDTETAKAIEEIRKIANELKFTDRMLMDWPESNIYNEKRQELTMRLEAIALKL